MSVPTVKLNSGNHIPLIGLGTFGGGSSKREVHDAVKAALEAGYRHIDAAFIYGNEVEVGEAIRESGVPREEIFVTTKLFTAFMRPENVRPAFERSLKNLGLKYIDLYLIHWPFGLKFNGWDTNNLMARDSEGHAIPDPEADYVDAWKVMEELQDEGLVKSIGISNFTVTKMKRLLANARIKPAVNQIEIHPYLQQNDLFKFAEEHNIHLTAYCPLGRPNSSIYNGTMEDPVIIRIAEKYNKTPAQVILNWAISRGFSAVPKSVTPSRIRENLVVFSIAKEDIEAINAIDKTFRIGRAGRVFGPAFDNCFDD